MKSKKKPRHALKSRLRKQTGDRVSERKLGEKKNRWTGKLWGANPLFNSMPFNPVGDKRRKSGTRPFCDPHSLAQREEENGALGRRARPGLRKSSHLNPVSLSSSIGLLT